jgi:membrane-associated protease RseP (regulator of RpoE activity)
MAQGISQRLRPPGRLVVALMGSGHVRDGHGVPHQLRALGVRDIAALLPWETGQACDELQAGLADAVFGLTSPAVPPQAERPRLGVVLDQGAQGVAVREVAKDSIAERAGVRAGDVLTQVAGRAVGETADVVAAVQRQAPGTWLPMLVKRGDQVVELVARFPPTP